MLNTADVEQLLRDVLADLIAMGRTTRLDDYQDEILSTIAAQATHRQHQGVAIGEKYPARFNPSFATGWALAGP